MIISKDTKIVRSIGFEDDSNFGILDGDFEKMFLLLSTSTYKDKYGSIVREICANAFDAMVEAGKGTLPIYVEYDGKRISFIDKGVGMSPHVIDSVYKNLGRSTKEDRADQIGGYGELNNASKKSNFL